MSFNSDYKSSPKLSLKIQILNFYTKWRYWEYWPFAVVYFPIIIYYLYLSLKARSFFYFSATNPSIDGGGMSGESKWEILKNIPDHLKPFTLLVNHKCLFQDLIHDLQNNKIHFPLIAKPDVGERGTQVKKIHDLQQLRIYLTASKSDFIIQEFIDYPIELGVFYYRVPDHPNGIVSSVVIKEFLKVIGDGRSTLFEIIENNPRARLQLPRLIHTNHKSLSNIPNEGEIIELEPIGNHCLGTKFIDGKCLIDNTLHPIFDEISKYTPGFYFGRYDLKCLSEEDLKKGIGIKIMELNGVGAEPSHIYDSRVSIFDAYKTLFRHWKIAFLISQKNRKKGHTYLSFSEGLQKIKQIRSLRQRRKKWTYSGT